MDEKFRSIALVKITEAVSLVSAESRSNCSMTWVILRHARRRLVTTSVTSNPTAEWIAGHVTGAFPWNEAPSHLIRDRDGAFGPAYTHRIRAMGIRDHPTAPRSP